MAVLFWFIDVAQVLHQSAAMLEQNDARKLIAKNMNYFNLAYALQDWGYTFGRICGLREHTLSIALVQPTPPLVPTGGGT